MNIAGLFGSDVFVRYTARYTWDSNQMAHAMMGFFGASLLAYAADVLGWAPAWALTFVVIPFLKDLTDYVADLAQEAAVFHIQPFHLREMRLDALTDNLFWNTGAVLAVLFAVAGESKGFWFYLLLVAAVALGGGIALLAKPHYGAEKRRFDKSALPFFFRLPTFTGNPAAVRDAAVEGNGAEETGEWREGRDGAVAAIEAFAYNRPGGARHLVVIGASGTRKTPLVVGIGSGATVRGETVRYVSQSALVEEIQSGAPESERVETEPLDPRVADMVVTDDVVSPLTPEQLPDWLRTKRTVWVAADAEVGEKTAAMLAARMDGPVQIVRLDAPISAEALNIKPPPVLLRLLAIGMLLTAAVLLLGALGIVLFSCPDPVISGQVTGACADVLCSSPV